MGGHTQEPWMLGARYPESHWIDVVSQTDERGLPFVSCKHHDEEANARRIVASVNATAGISVEALEAGCIAELVEALGAVLHDWHSDTGFVESVRSTTGKPWPWYHGDHSLANLRATLAKVKGEAA